MRAIDGLRLGVDGVGDWAIAQRIAKPETRHPDRSGGWAAAGFYTRGPVGSGCAVSSPAAALIFAMPSSHTPRRIACLQPSAAVILDAIGELERVVACTRYCADVIPAVSDGSRVILADSWTADTAEIVAKHPV